LQLIQIVWG